MYQLQTDLLLFVRPRFGDIFLPLLAQRFGGQERPSATELFMAEMQLYCTHRLPGGRTAVEVFTAEGDLSEEERVILRRWPGQSFLYMICEVLGAREIDDHVVIRAHSPDLRGLILVRPPQQQGARPVRRIAPKSLLINRLLPVREFYITVGPLQIVRPQDRDALIQSWRRQMQIAKLRGEEPVLSLTAVSGPDDVLEEFWARSEGKFGG
jgi:hypothetical protein